MDEIEWSAYLIYKIISDFITVHSLLQASQQYLLITEKHVIKDVNVATTIVVNASS